jgi:hypothetical protein
MASLTLRIVHKLLGVTTAGLGMLSIAVAVAPFMMPAQTAQAKLLKEKEDERWEVIEGPAILSGTVIKADTHTIIHLPEEFTSITREVLLGHKGKRTRYWGYCFPSNYDPKTVDTRRGFPGLIFMSEKERAVREAEARANKPRLNMSRLPTSKEIRQFNNEDKPTIRHQLEVFAPSTMCYIMTEATLAIGLDPDNDRLNDRMEQELGTNPQSPDSDEDGVIDGVEFRTGTKPLIRDTDSDGLVDGIEDKNWNGRIDVGDTDPRTADTDRDGLCDGVCRVKLKRQTVYMGEDMNLNGQVDANEFNPNRIDSDGDGIGDHVEFIDCISKGTSQCP